VSSLAEPQDRQLQPWKDTHTLITPDRSRGGNSYMGTTGLARAPSSPMVHGRGPPPAPAILRIMVPSGALQALSSSTSAQGREGIT
jgi:hypothetical protein